ncbi:hypothetical protein G6F65_022040 [Rhizopus arrhizus]|nr:hypothetical protein G6F65_022040 [Rhizopus arrhizus]
MSSHITAELVGLADFDWLLLDGEHSPNEVPMAAVVERSGADQAPAGYRVLQPADPVHRIRGRRATGRGRHALSAARHPRRCWRAAQQPLWHGPRLSADHQRQHLRAAADRKPSGHRCR